MNLNEQINRMKSLMGINESIENVSIDNLTLYFENSDLIDEKINPDTNVAFKIETLVSIKTFVDRVKYCNQTLKLLGQGSSRRVYELPDGKNVLKLAKNKKGIAQNEAESDIGTHNSDITAEIFYEDMLDDYILFVIMEKAVRIKEDEFKTLTDIPFQKFIDICYYSKRDYDFVEKLYKLQSQFDSELSMEFSNNMNDYVMNTGLSKFGDLATLTSYGKVMRDGTPTLVLVDYGLTDSVGSEYYGM